MIKYRLTTITEPPEEYEDHRIEVTQYFIAIDGKVEIGRGAWKSFVQDVDAAQTEFDCWVGEEAEDANQGDD